MGLLQWQWRIVFACVLLVSITIIGCAANNGTVKGGGTIIGNPTPTPITPGEPQREGEDRFYVFWMPGHLLLLFDITPYQNPIIIEKSDEEEFDIKETLKKNKKKIRFMISPMNILNR